MSKKLYTYNPDLDTFTEANQSKKKKSMKALAYLTSVLVTAAILNFVFSSYFPTPNERALSKQLTQLQTRYSEMQNEVGTMTAVLDNVMERDAQVYELLLGTQPIDNYVWHGGIGGHDIEGEKISENVSLKALNNDIDELERKLVLQSKYLDEVESSAAEKDARLRHIPSIRPIQMSQSDHYLRLLSGFGMRNHPVHKVNKMHTGLDFPAPKGTPVVATGDGTVVRIKYDRSGYGRSILIDHGFGYETIYAHMNEVMVKRGEKVNRGQQIGTVGRTGTATAPHVHYEVRLNDRPINPINYCMDGLSPEEYQSLVKAASVHNHSFD